MCERGIRNTDIDRSSDWLAITLAFICMAIIALIITVYLGINLLIHFWKIPKLHWKELI